MEVKQGSSLKTGRVEKERQSVCLVIFLYLNYELEGFYIEGRFLIKI